MNEAGEVEFSSMGLLDQGRFDSALRVFPAETRLTVYCWCYSHILDIGTRYLQGPAGATTSYLTRIPRPLRAEVSSCQKSNAETAVRPWEMGQRLSVIFANKCVGFPRLHARKVNFRKSGSLLVVAGN